MIEINLYKLPKEATQTPVRKIFVEVCDMDLDRKILTIPVLYLNNSAQFYFTDYSESYNKSVVTINFYSVSER